MKVETQKNILVTGGAGFIGSNLCEYFLSKGHQVSCLDNFATGHRHNLKDFINHPNFSLIEGDSRKFRIAIMRFREWSDVLHQAALGPCPDPSRIPSPPTK